MDRKSNITPQQHLQNLKALASLLEDPQGTVMWSIAVNDLQTEIVDFILDLRGPRIHHFQIGVENLVSDWFVNMGFNSYQKKAFVDGLVGELLNGICPHCGRETKGERCHCENDE